ncbi:hypothetical protein C0992_004894 [Termitomyces sp. T32_za158]|nr:hypothetical protein C0992_004894 [Termitomyces sp. T32_za158]
MGREKYYPEFDSEELPPHVYLRSVHNISAEWSWGKLKWELGDSAVLAFMKGEEEGVYNPSNPEH